jgi:hypothetical protein
MIGPRTMLMHYFLLGEVAFGEFGLEMLADRDNVLLAQTGPEFKTRFCQTCIVQTMFISKVANAQVSSHTTFGFDLRLREISIEDIMALIVVVNIVRSIKYEHDRIL